MLLTLITPFLLSQHRPAYHGAGTTQQERGWNADMAGLRIHAEWGFSKTKAWARILSHPRALKVQESDVKQLVRVCVLLTNAFSCCPNNANQTALYFDCQPPTLDAYFN